MRVADPAVRERAARLHRDLPEQHLAQLVEQRLHEVGFADRDAARRDDDVGAFAAAVANARSSASGTSGTTPMSTISQSSRVEHAVERVAVAVVDLAGGERRADRLQLVAGREERDAQLAVDRDLADAERRQHAELRRAHGLARRGTRPARASGPRRRSGGSGPALPTAPAAMRTPRRILARTLLHHDRVGARGHDAAGEDAHALARARRCGRAACRRTIRRRARGRFRRPRTRSAKRTA